MPRGRVRDELLGASLGARYQIQTFLLEEELGKVYQAVDLQADKRSVHVKVLHPHLAQDREAFTRFGREMVATAAVEHANTIAMLDFGEHDGVHYIVLEDCEGRTLREVLAEGPLSVERALEITGQIASAMAAAHAQGIIHRNLTPSTVLLLADADGDYVKVRDFGLARLLDDEATGGDDDDDGGITAVGARLGDVHYMAPEYIEHGRSDARCDVYALGIMLFEMIGGRPPFQGVNSGVVMDMHCERPPPSLLEVRPGVPQWIADLVDRLLVKDPSRRPADGGAVMTALSKATGSTFVPPRRVTRAPRTYVDEQTDAVVSPPTEEVEPPSGNMAMSVAVVALAVLTVAGMIAAIAVGVLMMSTSP